MDAISLRTLREEMLDDCRVARDAYEKAKARFERGGDVGYESCGHQLCRMYNAIEQMLLRVARMFENTVEDRRGWHTALVRRLSLEIKGVRPALLPADLKLPLQELRAFRHVFVHAYDLEIDPERLRLVLNYAGRIADRLSDLVETFIGKVAVQEQIEL